MATQSSVQHAQKYGWRNDRNYFAGAQLAEATRLSSKVDDHHNMTHLSVQCASELAGRQ